MRARWARGAETELAFWRAYFESGGLEWPEEYAARLDPRLAVQDVIGRLLPRDRRPRVLDCAAGPATTVGKLLDGEPIEELVAVDALADRYASMLAELGIEVPLPSRQGEIESLDELGLEPGFDVVYMRFALDHCDDPARAIRQMLAAARPDGTVVIEHYRDAERHEDFAGLRQWALDPEEGDLVVRNARERHSLRELASPHVVDVRFDDTWLVATVSLGRGAA